LLRGRQQALCWRPLVCCHAEFAARIRGRGHRWPVPAPQLRCRW
jgi:hypothetical protein